MQQCVRHQFTHLLTLEAHMSKTKLLFRLMLCALAASVVLAACRNEVLPQGGNPIPTPRAGVDVGNAPDSQAAATPDETS